MLNKVAITGASDGIGREIAAGFKGKKDIDTYLVWWRRKDKLISAWEATWAHCSVPWNLFDADSGAFHEFVKSDAQVQIHNAAINIDGMEEAEMLKLREAQNDFMAEKLAELQKNDIEDPRLFIPITSITSLFVDELWEKKFWKSPYALMKNQQSHMIEDARAQLLERGVSIVNIQPGLVKTEMTAHLWDNGLRFANMFGKRVTVDGRKYEQGRELKPEEVGNAIARLAMHYIDTGSVPDNMNTWPILNDEDLTHV